jgi:hypothetical protein
LLPAAASPGHSWGLLPQRILDIIPPALAPIRFATIPISVELTRTALRVPAILTQKRPRFVPLGSERRSVGLGLPPVGQGLIPLV